LRPLDAAPIFRILNDHSVAYLVIGGMAAEYHGRELGTDDIDITPEKEAANLARLGDALRALDAKFLDPDGQVMHDVDIPWDPVLLERMGSVRTATKFGVLDIVFRPDGTDGYDDLVRRAAFIVVSGVAAPVAALDDIIRSKAAAGRPKDVVALPKLEELAEALRRSPQREIRLPVDPARYIGD